MPLVTRRALQNATLAAASLLATLFVLEGLARLARGSGGQGKEAGTIALYTEYDPVLGWWKRPGGRATFSRHEYTVEVVMNSHGLRDAERAYQAAPGTFRILALGDSFIEAYSVPQQAMLTQVLEASLSRKGCRVEAINGGTAAYSADQEYLFYATEGVKYSPQVVIVFFSSNDVLFNGMDSQFGSPKPLLAEKDGRLVVVNAPVSKPPGSTPAPPASAPSEPAGSALFAWIEGSLLRGAPRAYNRLSALGLWSSIRPTTPHLQLKVYKKEDLPEIEHGWRQTALILGALAVDVEARGGRFLVAYVPSRMEVRDRDWELTQLRYGMDERWDRGRARTRLKQIARAAGFPVLDLTAALRAAERGALGGPYYLQDGHWNALGHRVAAAEVEGYLRREKWKPDCVSD